MTVVKWVMAIIGSLLIVGAVIAPTVWSAIDAPPRRDFVEYQIGAFASAIGSFFRDEGRLPRTLDELTVPSKSVDPYIDEIPRDPWAQTYRYQFTKAGFVIDSVGADGCAGTADDITLRYVVSPHGAVERADAR